MDSLFQHALHPRKIQLKKNIQLPHCNRHPTLSRQDNKPMGDTFYKEHENIRIWNINANTILTHNDYAELNELCLSIAEYNISIVGFQEINLDLLQQEIRNNITQVFKTHFNSVKLLFSTTPIKAPTAWKPGGTMLVFIGPIAHSVVNPKTDNLGRWCRGTINLCHNQSLTIYSAYNVNDTNISNSGLNTIYHQQWRLQRLAGNLHPNPRLQMVIDLEADITSLHATPTDSICIMGDLNETLGLHPELMSSICNKHKLYNVLLARHLEDCDTPTYQRGSKQLDYILLSHNAPTLIAMGHNPYNLLYNSDHQAMFLNMPIQHNSSPIIPTNMREIHSDSSKVEEFVNAIDNHLQHNHTMKQYETLLKNIESNDRPWELENIIDDQLGLTITSAKKVCHRKYRPPWSEKLHHASLRVRLWNIVKTEKLNKIDNTIARATIRETLPTLPEVLLSMNCIKAHINQSKTQLRNIRINTHNERREFLNKLKERIATRQQATVGDPIKALKIINRQLQDGKQHKNIRKVFSPTNHQPLTKVQITKEVSHIDPATGKVIYIDPDTNTCVPQPTILTIDTKKELEKLILN